MQATSVLEIAAARAPVVASSDLAVESVTTLEAAEAIAPAWLALEQRQDRAVFFQSFGWCLHVWRTRLAVASASAPEPRLIVVRERGRIVAIWPLAIKSGLSGRFAHDLTDPFGQYSDVLIAADADSEAIAAAVFAELKRWRIDGIVLRKVREDSVLARWLAQRAAPIGTREGAPEIALAAIGGHEAYRRSVSSKTRKNLRNARNKMMREGRLVHTVLDEPASVSAAIARCFDGRTSWLETSGLSSTAFADPAFPAIVAGLTKADHVAPSVVAMRLTLAPQDAEAGDRLTELSLHWGFEHAGRYYAYMASKNPAFDAASPGRLHLEDVIAAQAARGSRTIDLLVPALPYKLSMASGTICVSTYGLAFTMRGRLAIDGWHARLRPALKAGLMHMPNGLRRIVMGARGYAAKLRSLTCPDAAGSLKAVEVSAPTRL